MPIPLPDTGTATSSDPALRIEQSGSGEGLVVHSATAAAIVGSSDGDLSVHAKTSNPQGIGLLGEGAIGVGARGDFAGSFATGPIGVAGQSADGSAVVGLSSTGTGVQAVSQTGVAAHARSGAGVAVYAESDTENAVLAEARSINHAGVFGFNSVPQGLGVVGLAPAKGGVGVVGDGARVGVQATGVEGGVYAEAATGIGVTALASGDHGVLGMTSSPAHAGVAGVATGEDKDAAESVGVFARAEAGIGLRAVSTAGPAAIFDSSSETEPAVRISATGGDAALQVEAAGRGGVVIGDPASFNQIDGDAVRIGRPPTTEYGLAIAPASLYAGRAAVTIDAPGTAAGIYMHGAKIFMLEGDIVVIKGGISAGTLEAGSGAVSGVAVIDVDAGYTSADGVRGIAGYQPGVGRAICGINPYAGQPNQYGGFFIGDVKVLGTLTKTEDCFEIDHPQRPTEQYLRHVAVESDDRRTIYDGEVVLDRAGAAAVSLPAWFTSLNTRPRYQLTAIGRPAPELHIAGEIDDRGTFRIAGGTPGQRVCWQVTAVRADAWAAAHPFRVEHDKDRHTRGTYLHPEPHGAPIERGEAWREYEAVRKDAPAAAPTTTAARPTDTRGPSAGAADASRTPVARPAVPPRPRVSAVELPESLLPKRKG